jgi:hypothetical protein
VWAVLSVSNQREAEEELAILDHFDTVGTRLDAYSEKGVSVYLYELNKDGMAPDLQEN